MNLSVGDAITLGTLALGILGYFFEVSKIKIKPLSALGRLLNGETIRKVDALSERVSDLQEKMEESEIKEPEKYTKKGTYKMNVKLTAAANANYKAAPAKKVTIVVKVK